MFKRDYFEKIYYTIYNIRQEVCTRLIAKSNDTIQKENIANIGKQFQELIFEISDLRNRVLEIEVNNIIQDYNDIYDFINKNDRFKHFILSSENSEYEKAIINKLLQKAFGEIFKLNKYNLPICLGKIIEDCEKKLNEQSIDENKEA